VSFDEQQNIFFSQVLKKSLDASAFNLSEVMKTSPVITFSLKSVDLLSLSEVEKKFYSVRDFSLSSISQSVLGNYRGKVHLIFSHNLLNEILPLLLDQESSMRHFGDFESDELLEVGNEIINNILLELSNKFSADFPSTVPVYDTGMITEILISNLSNFIFAEVKVSLDNKELPELFRIIYSTINITGLIEELASKEPSHAS